MTKAVMDYKKWAVGLHLAKVNGGDKEGQPTWIPSWALTKSYSQPMNKQPSHWTYECSLNKEKISMVSHLLQVWAGLESILD